LKTALLQLCSSDDPSANLEMTLRMLEHAVSQGAKFVLTPEVTNCVSTSRSHQNMVLQEQSEDITLAGLRKAAAMYEIWILIGSLGLKTGDPDGRFANRSFLISPVGEIVAEYDKIHMFDVQVSKTETYRESDGFRPGSHAVVADASFAKIGLTICYDLRFPNLFNKLAMGGASVITVPAAFSPITGVAHWEALLRARAIETGSFVLAPAQCGHHQVSQGKSRQTYGHSMAISPWGEVIAQADEEPGIHFFDLDVTQVEKARSRVPALEHARKFTGP